MPSTLAYFQCAHPLAVTPARLLSAGDPPCPRPGKVTTPRSDACAAALGGKIYLMGGWGRNYTGPLGGEALDLATGEWEALPEGMLPRGDCEAAAVADDCVLGGWGGRPAGGTGCVLHRPESQVEGLGAKAWHASPLLLCCGGPPPPGSHARPRSLLPRAAPRISHGRLGTGGLHECGGVLEPADTHVASARQHDAPARWVAPWPPPRALRGAGGRPRTRRDGCGSAALPRLICAGPCLRSCDGVSARIPFSQRRGAGSKSVFACTDDGPGRAATPRWADSWQPAHSLSFAAPPHPALSIWLGRLGAAAGPPQAILLQRCSRMAE
jgi:hypothetical protein